MIKNFNFIFNKKIIYKNFFLLLLFFFIIFFFYFSIPNFFNYSPQFIKESLKINNDIDIKDISKISYKVFPTPRLKVFGRNLSLKENILVVNGSEIEIILSLNSILKYKKIYYKKIIIKGGATIIDISKINQLFNYLKKNKQKISFKENNIILTKNNKYLFEINDSITKISSNNNRQQLSINGIFLKHKIIFLLNSKLEDGINIEIKIPKLDILSSIFFRNKDSFGIFNGFVNLEVLNNFFQFNFTKEKNIKINKGFVRNNIINSSFEGEITLQPNFFVDLNFEPTILNIEKLFPIIQKKYFSDNFDKLELIKKINGFFTFKKMFSGNISFENGEILFKDFKIGLNNSIFFDAKISEFGKKGKIHFNILKTIKYKKKSPKELAISGFIVPSISKVVFEKLVFDKEDYKKEKIKNYEEKFMIEVVQKSLSNIFNNSKMNNFFNNFNN